MAKGFQLLYTIIASPENNQRMNGLKWGIPIQDECSSAIERNFQKLNNSTCCWMQQIFCFFLKQS